MRALQIISRVAWGLAILALPFGRFLLIDQAGNSGRFNPYASVVLQMSEVLILVAFLAWAMGHRTAFNTTKPTTHQQLTVAIIITALLMLPMLWSENFEGALGAIIPLMAGIAAIALMWQNVLSKKRVALLFISTMMLQAILGIAQVAIGNSALGESMISAQTAGVAKIMIAGEPLLRAYGTFPHSNVLAGYLVVALALIPHISKKQKKLKILLGAVLSIGLLFTASKGAILALLITLLMRSKLSTQKNGPSPRSSPSP